MATLTQEQKDRKALQAKITRAIKIGKHDLANALKIELNNRLIKSKYDFKIETSPLLTKTGLPTNRIAIIRKDVNRVISVVGKKYKVILHVDVIKQIEKSLPVSLSSRKICVCKDGNFMFANYESPKVSGVEVRKGDIVKFGVQLFNSYNGKLAVGMRLLAHRVVCSNGMTVPKSISTLQVRHMYGADLIQAKEEFIKKIKQFEKFQETWKVWATQPVKDYQLEDFLEKKVAEKTKIIILDKFKIENDLTVWGAFNAVTWFGTHIVSATRSEIVKKSSDLAYHQFGFDRAVVEKFYKQNWN